MVSSCVLDPEAYWRLNAHCGLISGAVEPPIRAALTANKSRYFGGDNFVRFAQFGCLS
jgi:hypothetical protein